MTANIKIPDTRYIGMLVLWLGIILLIRLVSLWFNNSELFFDEAQYWFWAQDLQFGYFSKPPLIAWIINATTSIFGSDDAFFVRLAAPLFHTATAVVVFLIARELFNSKVAFWSGVIYATLPSVSLSSGIISTDVPLLFFWSLALFGYVKLQKDYDLGWVFLIGLAVGLAINAKYAGLYFIVCATVHFLMKPSANSPPKRPYFWLAIVIALIMLAPNVLWNLENGLVTLSHTGENISGAGYKFTLIGVIEFIGSQFGVMGPICFFVLIASYFKLIQEKLSDEHRLLIAFSLPILLLIVAQAFLNKANANWAAPAYIAGVILVADIFVNRIPWHWLKASISIHAFALVILAVAVCFAGHGQIVLPNGLQPFERTQGAKEIASVIEEQLNKKEYNGVVTTDRKLSALIQYNLRHREESRLAWRAGETPRDHFEFDRAFQDSLRDPILIVSQFSENRNYDVDFKSIINLGEREIMAGEIKKLFFFELSDHKSFQ